MDMDGNQRSALCGMSRSQQLGVILELLSTHMSSVFTMGDGRNMEAGPKEHDAVDLWNTLGADQWQQTPEQSGSKPQPNYRKPRKAWK